MMPIWVCMIRYDGEMSCSTHLTEKGCASSAIEDLMDYLGVYHDEPDTHRNDARSDDEEKSLPTDMNEIRKMTAKEMWSLFRVYSEYTWDHYEYEIECTKTVVRG